MSLIKIDAAKVAAKAAAAARRDAMFTGVEFAGVMCSAKKEDQDGLLAVLTAYQLQGETFQPTRFDFRNGNALVLTRDNIQQFLAVWMPFRQSFFNPNEV